MYGAFVAFVGLWGVPYLTQVYGLSRVQASSRVALVALGLLVSAPLVGWVSDRWLMRRKGPLIATAAVHAGVWVVLALPREPLPEAVLGPACFLLGFASGGVALVFASVREVNDPGHVGVALGFHNLPVFLAFALMQWLTGVLLDSRWDGALAAGARVYSIDAYRAAFSLCLAAALGSLLASLLVTETRCRNVWVDRRGRPGVVRGS
jgi:sugar phosphate permease